MEKLNEKLSGNCFVETSTRPPEKLPGRSAVKVLSVMTLSSKRDGIKSNWNAFLSGSALGSSIPFKCVLE